MVDMDTVGECYVSYRKGAVARFGKGKFLCVSVQHLVMCMFNHNRTADYY